MLTWALALGVSVSAHGAGAVAIYLAIRPGDIPEQPVPETRLELAAYQVDRSTARETALDPDQALAGNTSGAALGQGLIATSRANALQPDGIETSARAPEGESIAAAAPEGSEATLLAETSDPVQAVIAPQTSAAAAQTLADAAPQAAISAQSVPAASLPANVTPARIALPNTALRIAPTDRMATVAPVALPISNTLDPAKPTVIRQTASPTDQVATASPAALPVSTTLGAAQPTVLRQTETQPATPTAQTLAPMSNAASPAIPETLNIAQRPVNAETAPHVQPKTDRARAALAFEGSGDGAIDPVSLSAFQSFMEPGDLGGAAADVRDGITGALSAIPCARLQVAFDPTDNSLQVSGHVPDRELRAEVVAAMQAKMGADIPVRDTLLILPRPQCGALTGIANVGLPQSTDQITNPLLLGESTHAREFRYTAGNPLVMELQGADYDAYVYVDYFDADGNVVHLLPNEFTPLTLTPAESALQIGSDTVLPAGEPGLYIEIGPPFGQEIAVAFASSVPLYDGVRPLVEPAGPYLNWLRERVADARARDPAFKGEWVYFFVTTAAE
ncbi:MAG: DUF4384 domain-containing protein [Pelagibaca sp.]